MLLEREQPGEIKRQHTEMKVKLVNGKIKLCKILFIPPNEISCRRGLRYGINWVNDDGVNRDTNNLFSRVLYRKVSFALVEKTGKSSW